MTLSTRSSRILLLAFLLGALGSGTGALAGTSPIHVPCEEPIPDTYIVVLDEGSIATRQTVGSVRPPVDQLTDHLTTVHGGRVVHRYHNTARGFATVVDGATARRLAADPHVAFVEQSCPIEPSGQDVQNNAPWGLDRVDQEARTLDTRYEYNETGFDDPNEGGIGTRAHIYIIDTGISPSMDEFGGRLRPGRAFFPADDGPSCSDPTSTACTTDDYGDLGHGTFVASKAAGSTHGVAKDAFVYPLRIFKQDSRPEIGVTGTAEVLAAVDWLIANHQDPAVANMSFKIVNQTHDANGNLVEFTVMEDAIRDAVAVGIVMVAAANNDNTDACTQTPSKIPEVLTVGATNEDDRRMFRPDLPEGNPRSNPFFASNFGPCVDLWAPGDDVKGLHKDGITEIEGPGTSFAAPMVAGAAALFLESNPGASPTEVTQYLLGQASPGRLDFRCAEVEEEDPPNLPLYDECLSSPDLMLFAKPAHACFSWSCDAGSRTCTFDATCSKAPPGSVTLSWDFGDGSAATGTTTTHTYSTSDIFNVTLTVNSVNAKAESRSGCVNVSGAGLIGCFESGATHEIPQVIGEFGQVTDLTHAARTVVLGRSYTDPVVIARPPSFDGSHQSVVRVTDVQSDRFTFQIEEAPDKDGSHTTETVSYVVLESGSWELPGGAEMEVGKISTSATVGRNVAGAFTRVDFATPFRTSPLVFSQVQTRNDPNWVKTRQLRPTTSSVRVALEEEEAATTAHGVETIGWVAIDPGNGAWSGHLYLAGDPGDIVTHDFTSFNFGVGFSDVPKFLASLASRDGADNSALRYQSLTASGVSVQVEEDTTFDPEVGHTTESVHFLAIEGSPTTLEAFPR